MTKQKRKKNNIIILILSSILFCTHSPSLKADQLKCKKFDIMCKSKKFVDETVEYQKKEFGEAKKQLNKNKKEIKDKIPKIN